MVRLRRRLQEAAAPVSRLGCAFAHRHLAYGRALVALVPNLSTWITSITERGSSRPGVKGIAGHGAEFVKITNAALVFLVNDRFSADFGDFRERIFRGLLSGNVYESCIALTTGAEV